MAIINLNSQFGTLNGVIMLNTEIRSLVLKCLKKNEATKLIDTEETLMYLIEIKDTK